jgi:HKD family nuclease
MLRRLCGVSSDKAVVVGLPADFDLNKQLRSAKEVFLATAFATTTGWNVIKGGLLDGKAAINIVTGLYFCHTEPKLLRDWLDLIPKRPNFCVSLACSTKANNQGKSVYHPKVMIVCGDRVRFAIVGSGNLTNGGLHSNVECSIYTEESAHIESLRQWFADLECKRLSKEAIERYQPHYDRAASARKVVEEAQEAAEQGIKSAIAFLRRSDAIQAAKDYFGSPVFAGKKGKLSEVISDFRGLLDYYAFNFDGARWAEFYKDHRLGWIRPAYLPDTLKDLTKIQKGLRFLFGEQQAIEERLPELMERHGNLHVRGVGPHLISKFLVAHDPKRWFIYDDRVAKVLESFGFSYSGKSGPTALYLAFAEAMRSFKDDCGAEDSVALDAFLSDRYEKRFKGR